LTIKGEILAKSELGMSYKIKDLEEAKLILGMHINKDPQSRNITISQEMYCLRILEHFNMANYTPVSIPLSARLTLSIDDCPVISEETKEIKRTLYHILFCTQSRSNTLEYIQTCFSLY